MGAQDVAPVHVRGELRSIEAGRYAWAPAYAKVAGVAQHHACVEAAYGNISRECHCAFASPTPLTKCSLMSAFLISTSSG